MTDYISREVAIAAAEEYGLGNGCVLGVHSGIAECIAAAIERIPAADVEPVRHGRWKLMDGCKARRACTCCGWNVPEYGKFYVYCPNCGAKMDLEEQNAASR